MAKLPETTDPTLDAVDAAIEAAQDKKARPYLGASSIGDDCHRKLWLGFHWATAPNFRAHTLKLFDDGHRSEDIQAKRLRMVDGLTLWTHNPAGEQYGFVDLDGHFRGHYDGVIQGLLQAPATPHVWEHKATAEASQRKLEKLKDEHGEKNALVHWNKTYYVQAQVYMRKTELERHYMTVSSPGCRHTVSCRTDLVNEHADFAIKKAADIIASDRSPQRVSDDPGHWQCKFCQHYDLCQMRAELPLMNCRTCVSSSPAKSGFWTCDHNNKTLSVDDQRTGCEYHLYIPDLIPWKLVTADPQERSITYQTGDGAEIKNATTKGPNQFQSAELQHTPTSFVGDPNIETLRNEFDGEVVAK